MIYVTDELSLYRSRGILSDLDGTLYSNHDLQSDYERAFISFTAVGLQVSEHRATEVILGWRKKLESVFGFPASEFEVLRAVGLKVCDWLIYSEGAVCPEDYLFPDITMALAIKAVRRFAFFDVVTNSSRVLAERTLKAIGLEGHIDGLWTPEENDYIGKPYPEFYCRISKLRDLSNSMVLVVGDRWHIDLLGVDKLGMHAILINGPEQAKKLFQLCITA